MDEKQASRNRSAIRALTRAYENAVAALEATTDPQEAFDNANELGETLRKMYDQVAEIRTNAVGQIWESERLSLASLAQRIGVSKTRADEIVRAAKAAKRTGTSEGKSRG